MFRLPTSYSSRGRTIRALMIASTVVTHGLLGGSSLAATATTKLASSAKAIRAVDFRNFTYNGIDTDPVTVKNGEYYRDDESGILAVSVSDVDHGDLDGDGVEEAVVTIGWSTGGSGFFSDGLVFRMSGGKPVHVTELGVGDRADGGIDNLVIVGGVLRADRYAEDGHGLCCPGLVERTEWKLRGSALVRVGAVTRRRIVNMGSLLDGPDGVPTISFLPGTSEAILQGSAGTSAVFSARAGQRVSLAVAAPAGGAVTITVSGSGLKASVKAPGTWSTVLKVSGKYTVAVSDSKAEPLPTVRATLTIR